MYWKSIAFAAALWSATAHAQEPLPPRLAGTWRIVRILPSTNQPCWAPEQAKTLVGTTLTYRPKSMRWRGGSVPLIGITTRTLTPQDFAHDYPGVGEAKLENITVQVPPTGLLEVNFQHEDMDITGSTTEVPGDSVLLIAPSRIVVSACGVFYEATRLPVRPNS